jgi:nucleoside-diphosphate-sugar epimerase
MKILVTGAGGFIGGHLVERLVLEKNQVVAVDKKPLTEWFQENKSATNIVADLMNPNNCDEVIDGCDFVYNLAADMGGMGFIENNKSLCMLSVIINTNLLQSAVRHKIKRYFFSSSACVYPSFKQNTTSNTSLSETDAYPADPEDGYGWEKLFSERMCQNFSEDFGLEVRIARYHNVYGPNGTYEGGREKVPAAACRKVIEFSNGLTNSISIWGDGNQVRSFTYIDDCVIGSIKLMESNFNQPLNIGSSMEISILDLYKLILNQNNIGNANFIFDLTAPQGVRGRSSNNELIKNVLNWVPNVSIDHGIKKTYDWIKGDLDMRNSFKQ